jgi:predicted glutamine amidotransferase
MCRMFAVLSSEPVPVHKYLKETEFSLYRQAEAGNQGDGWGIGYYSDGSLTVRRSEKAAYEDPDFDPITKPIRSNLFIAHVRKASNPKHLPRPALISEENSQPFGHSNLLFVHNGTLFIPDQVLSSLGTRRQLVKGVNDSEVLFAYLLQSIDNCRSVEEAFGRLETGLWEIQRRSGASDRAPYKGLNIMFSDGKKLYAYGKYLEDAGKAICSETPVFQLQYRLSDEEFVVASERLTAESWEPLPNGYLLKAEIVGGKPVIEVEKVA